MEPRLVATDIDGTIVPGGGTVSDRTRRTLRSCVAAGVDVVLVTGRPPRWMPPVLAELDLPGTVVCANGAALMDASSGQLREVTAIPGPVLREAVERLARRFPGAVLAVETPAELLTGPGWTQVRSRQERREGLAPTTRSSREAGSLEALVAADEVFKLVLVDPDASPDGLLESVREEVGDSLSATRSSLGSPLVEMGPAGVTKASALERLARSRGIAAAEVVAFGDMPNDVEMLRWAGRGYAMAGAHPEALAAADAVAPPAEEDGVATVLAELLADRLA